MVHFLSFFWTPAVLYMYIKLLFEVKNNFPLVYTLLHGHFHPPEYGCCFYEPNHVRMPKASTTSDK